MWVAKSLLSNGGNSDASMKDPTTREFVSSLSKCDLPDRYWVLTPVRLYEAKDLYVVSTESDGFMYFAARTDDGLAQIPRYIRENLERLR
jgi:hypothetical protein